MTVRAAVLLFILIAGASNVLFAWSLSADTIGRGFWVAIAVASALYTTQSLSVLVRQLKARDWARAFAAFVLALGTLGYDVLAAYGLSRAEQSRLEFAAGKDSSKVKSVRRDLEAAENALAGYAKTPPTIEAKGKLSACKRNCESQKAAVAEADGRDKLRQDVTKLRTELANLEAPTSGDTRSGLIGPELAAWFPVLIVTLGSLLGGFSAGQSTAPEPPKSEPSPAPEPLQSDAHPIVPKLRRVAAAPPEGVQIEKGWIKGSQRKLASAIGTAPSRLNAQLRDAAEAGAIELRTDGGTAVRLN